MKKKVVMYKVNNYPSLGLYKRDKDIFYIEDDLNGKVTVTYVLNAHRNGKIWGKQGRYKSRIDLSSSDIEFLTQTKKRRLVSNENLILLTGAMALIGKGNNDQISDSYTSLITVVD